MPILLATHRFHQPAPGFLGIASATEAFAQFAPHTAARRLIGDYELRFAFAALVKPAMEE